MRQAAAAVVVVAALGACTLAPAGASSAGSDAVIPAASSTAAPSVPLASVATEATASPKAARASATTIPATPSPSLSPLEGARNDALVVLLDHADEPGDGPPAVMLDITLEAVALDGTRRPLRHLPDVRAAGWQSGRAVMGAPVSLGANGHLLVTAEATGRLPRATRTLIIDVDDPEGAPIELPGELWNAHWGPDGRLAWEDDGTIRVLDPRTREAEAVVVPEGFGAGTYWIEDGSGWLASEVDDSSLGSAHGRLLLDGTFDAGVFPLYQPTGVERIFSSRGSGLGLAVSDGPSQSELALTETRGDLPPPCHCVTWLVQVQPSNDPAFADGMWDADGDGVWVPLHEHEGANARLSHLPEPMVETKVATLPAATDWTIVGADPDDERVALRSEALRTLAFVNTSTGEVVELTTDEERDHTPFLVGWLP